MHVNQWIAVRGESSEDAIGSVDNYLDEQIEKEFYDYFHNYQRTISYEADPEKFRECVDNTVESKKAEVEFMVEKILKKRENVEDDKPYDFYGDIEEWLAAEDHFEAKFQFNLKRYTARRVLEIMSCEWVAESFFFDIEHGVAGPNYMWEEIQSGKTDWWIVHVDFHF